MVLNTHAYLYLYVYSSSFNQFSIVVVTAIQLTRRRIGKKMKNQASEKIGLV